MGWSELTFGLVERKLVRRCEAVAVRGRARGEHVPLCTQVAAANLEARVPAIKGARLVANRPRCQVSVGSRCQSMDITLRPRLAKHRVDKGASSRALLRACSKCGTLGWLRQEGEGVEGVGEVQAMLAHHLEQALQLRARGWAGEGNGQGAHTPGCKCCCGAPSPRPRPRAMSAVRACGDTS